MTRRVPSWLLQVQEAALALNLEQRQGRAVVSIAGPRFSGLQGQSLSGAFRWERDVVRLERAVLQQANSRRAASSTAAARPGTCRVSAHLRMPPLRGDCFSKALTLQRPVCAGFQIRGAGRVRYPQQRAYPALCRRRRTRRKGRRAGRRAVAVRDQHRALARAGDGRCRHAPDTAVLRTRAGISALLHLPSVPRAVHGHDACFQGQAMALAPCLTTPHAWQVHVPAANMEEILPAARLLSRAAALTPSDYDRAKAWFLHGVDASKLAAQVTAHLRYYCLTPSP